MAKLFNYFLLPFPPGFGDEGEEVAVEPVAEEEEEEEEDGDFDDIDRNGVRGLCSKLIVAAGSGMW